MRFLHLQCNPIQFSRWLTLLLLLDYSVCSYAALPQKAIVQQSSPFWLVRLTPTAKAPVWLVGDSTTAPPLVPLGSLWKLLIYSYSIEQGLPDTLYECRAGNQAAKGDEYCCSSNERVGRDVALARSCGAYFSPQRLHINRHGWQHYWQQKALDIPWIQSLDSIQPNTQVTVASLLKVLNSLPPHVIAQNRQALLGRLLQPTWSDVLPYLGGAYRFKTFTWTLSSHNPSNNLASKKSILTGNTFGGAAGWLADGTVFWLGGQGGSHQVVLRAAPVMQQRLPLSHLANTTLDEACVDVHYFKQYPIESIYPVGKPNVNISNGLLKGKYVVTFKNNQSLNVQSNSELSVIQNKAKEIQVWGKLGLQDYIARVIDREADAHQTEAAKALSVAARSYLRQNAYFHQGCWQIDDDSHKQRVSANPASAPAKEVAAFTEGLSLTGSPIYYHKNKTAVNTLNWQKAVDESEQGAHYLTLLHHAYPQASWLLGTNQAQCNPVLAAQSYLQQNLPKALFILKGETGIEPVKGLKVCQLDYGNPYADQQTQSIYVRDWQSLNGRITLWHEYLHLALRFHPNGQNESYIEAKARQLASSVSFTSLIPTSNAQRIHHAQ